MIMGFCFLSSLEVETYSLHNSRSQAEVKVPKLLLG